MEFMMNARRTATTALLGVAAAGTLLASASAATAQDRHDPAAPGRGATGMDPMHQHHPGMARMHQLMIEQNPGVARMHELMAERNPGMAHRHQLMTDGPR